MYKRKNRIIIVVILMIALVGMIGGFAMLSSTLEVGSTATINGNFKLSIDDIIVKNTQGNAESRDIIIDNDLMSASFITDLYNKGDSVTYTVTVKNIGNINAKLRKIDTILPDDNNNIIFNYDNSILNTIIRPNSTLSFDVEISVSDTEEELDDVLGATYKMILDFIQTD